MVGVLAVGDRVRIVLHGRSVSAWVASTGQSEDDFSDIDVSRLLSIVKIQGRGPDADLVQLFADVRRRWQGRIRSLFVSATPANLVQTFPTTRNAKDRSVFESGADLSVAACVKSGLNALVRRGPTISPLATVLGAAINGPTLVVIPTITRARLLASALKRQGLSVALLPDDWANAAGGVDVAIGARSAVFARVPNLRAIVVIDEHDDSLQEERTPTWHARDVAIMRAKQQQISCILSSPIPSVTAAHWAQDQQLIADEQRESTEWPTIQIVDRSVDDDWPNSLVSSALVVEIRDHSRRVALVYNAKGRAKLVACAACKSLGRCSACNGAMIITSETMFECGRCKVSRPQVCLACGGGKFAVLKPGISRLREEIALAAGRKIEDVVEISSQSKDAVDTSKMLFIGTESLLHRLKDVDSVVFLDIDQELSAPRYRASEITSTLLIGAARLVSRSSKDGRVLVQTFNAQHPLLKAVFDKNIDSYIASETASRQAMHMPPFSCLAQVSGVAAPEVVASIENQFGISVSADDHGTYLIRSDTWQHLSSALDGMNLSKSARYKLVVDPPRV